MKTYMKRTVVAIVMLVLVFFSGMVKAQSPVPPTSGQGQNPDSPNTASIRYNTLYASANSDLWFIDTNSGTSTYVGPIGYQGTDIAFSGTNLFGVSFSDFLSIDPTTGNGHVIGYTGYNDVNALTIAPDGNVYAATVSGAFIRIDKTTGSGTLIGYYGPGLGSSGDIAFRDDGVLFASIKRSGYSNSWLAVVNLVNGTATPIGDIGFPDVWGLSFKDGELYGVTNGGDILKINTSTGVGTRLNISTANFWGLSTSGKALGGDITSPLDNATIGPSSIQISANAYYYGGNGVKQVEFYVFYDRVWHLVGVDTSSPYNAYWQTPIGLTSQQLLFRIDVIGNDGQETGFAGGIRRVNFVQSLGGSGIVENWIPVRAYLNQRSLSPDGDSKCNVSSMAMVLAMEGFIGLDYQSMANKANEMYPYVLKDGIAYVYKMRDELRRQGAVSEYRGPWSANTAWPFLKSEIDAGHPVILGPTPGILTPAGHFVVGVGYQETSSGKRQLIAYDPFGRWLGKPCSELPGNCTGNYDVNKAGDPTSHKGQWVYYDFDKFFGGNNGYLITARRPSVNNSFSVSSLTPPDPTSDELEDIGTYQGIRVMHYQIYLSIIAKTFDSGQASLVNGDFENGPIGWVEYSTHGWSLIMNSDSLPVAPHSGNWAAWLGGDNDEVSYISQQVRVPTSQSYLTYWHWIASDETGCNWDYGKVVVNETIVDEYGLCSSTSTGGWVPHSVNLGAYIGQLVSIQIRAETDSSVNSNLFIDDVSFSPAPLLYSRQVSSISDNSQFRSKVPK